MHITFIVKSLWREFPGQRKLHSIFMVCYNMKGSRVHAASLILTAVTQKVLFPKSSSLLELELLTNKRRIFIHRMWIKAQP